MIIKYMYRNKVCSVLDVDMIKKKVTVTNFTNNIMMRAFGRNEHPTYQEYEAFLESRCIPRTRDNLKWHLREIGVDFYDPLAIVLKTKGKMAEDHFWLDVTNEMEYEKHTCGDLIFPEER